MDVINVPILEADATVEQAIARLEQTNLAAVVLDDGSELRLVFANALGDARENGIQRLSDIPDEELEALGRPLALAGMGGPRNSPGPPSLEEERHWGLAGHDFAGVRTSSTSAMIVSRTETAGVLIRHRLQCEKIASHLFPRPPLSAGAYCPRCPSTSGTPPRVW